MGFPQYYTIEVFFNVRRSQKCSYEVVIAADVDSSPWFVFQNVEGSFFMAEHMLSMISSDAVMRYLGDACEN